MFVLLPSWCMLCTAAAAALLLLPAGLFFPELAKLTVEFLPKVEAAYYIHNFKGTRPGAAQLLLFHDTCLLDSLVACFSVRQMFFCRRPCAGACYLYPTSTV
jgi:hypothetical protein